jgi:hypothetical protein
MAKKTPNRPAERAVPKVAVAPASPDGPNRKVRKEEARRQREVLQRKIARRKFFRWGAAIVVVLVAAGVGTAIFLNSGSSTPSKTGQSPSPTLVGMQTGLAPWNRGEDGLLQRDRAIGIPFAATEQLVFHHHDLLQIFVNGHKVAVPLGIGIGTNAAGQISFYTSMHTHDTSGIVHIESPIQRTFTLGNFFDVWGVTFSSKNIGGYEASGDKQIRVYLNGKPYTGDPRNLPLTQHDDVVVTYGTKAQLPHPIPVTYPATISTTCSPDC